LFFFQSKILEDFFIRGTGGGRGEYVVIVRLLSFQADIFENYFIRGTERGARGGGKRHEISIQIPAPQGGLSANFATAMMKNQRSRRIYIYV
jgi:hypothetical protein